MAERLQNRSLEFALALTLPAAVGFITIPNDIVQLVYERGAFDSIATEKTALALAAFATGLPAYVMMKVFQPAFFAREDMRTPFYFSVVMVLINITLSLTLFPIIGHVGIAIATSVSAWVNLTLLAATQWKRGDFRPDGLTIKRITLLLMSAVVMGALIWLVRDMVLVGIEAQDFGIRLLAVGGMISIGALVYFAMAIGSGAVDRAQAKRLLRR